MSNASWKIRPATSSDIEVLVALRTHLLDGASEASYASRTSEERLRWKAAYRDWLEPVLASGERARIVVADRDGEAVACATGLIDSRPPAPDCLNGWCGWIQSVVVSPPCRRQGMAERLMRELLQWFAAHGVTKVLLETTPAAEALYRKLGFVRSMEGLLNLSGGRP
ncbi:GNAT family N-acetyltransferase [Pseudomonas sp. CBSPBW29]|uniref:GNAT family N-acetyltransferase n=1 Tax=Pseudomonas sp. CBS TaxID=2971912 RepID=UPI0021ACF711|nr:GNAT family N-acetyltransferase [Pseudomonas sp. CBS]WEL43533.1 GNAT family N-acetyltransferase [Pseudomonas sp. CBSPBW29]WEL64603.1 GNAT family N-acetyltransferase [Pseudomonas sp. CBSPGW29]WEL68070.1 GNAT family N-acetyltransferase [Pseudomonas sp. CBSPCGW29]WEL75092.1 GNAT family N-acetyltransferase [Pseudomonas sp. CBSPAW29]WEL80663.1 GNAT family N-acetyltransferase [Pseudomonas sp. CBSPCAW29]WEL89178.1 GNAT family N-acetyltransferase [Pseudomonas sp. CBSPCBW29]